MRSRQSAEWSADVSGIKQPGHAAQPQVTHAAREDQARPAVTSTSSRRMHSFYAESHGGMVQRDRERVHSSMRQTDALRPAFSVPYRPLSSALPTPLSNHQLMLIVFIVSIVIIILLWPGNPLKNISNYVATHAGLTTLQSNLAASSGEPARVPGDYNLQGAPSLNARQIDAILASYDSPATGTGQIWLQLGRDYGIDPAFAVAFFILESSAGTNPGWAGLKPDGGTTHNVGNIICAGYQRCYGRFRDYASWEEGIADWYRLIDVEYIKGRGTVTVEQILPIYAPSFENDVQGYINGVTGMVDGWKINGVPQ